MRLRVFVEPQQGASYSQLLRVAQHAESLGFDGFFRSDHYLAMGGDGLPGPTDAWVTLAGIAWVVWGEGDREVHPHRWRGVWLGIGGALGQAVGLLFSLYGLAGGYSPFSANLVRVSAGLAALLIYFGLRRRIPSTLAGLKDRRASGLILLGAATGPVLGVILSLVAIAKAPMGVAATLMSLSPVLLLPVAHFGFKEKVGVHAILGTALALAGAAALFIV